MTLTADPTAPASYAWPDVAATLARLDVERRATALDDAIRRTGIESAGTHARAAQIANA